MCILNGQFFLFQLLVLETLDYRKELYVFFIFNTNFIYIYLYIYNFVFKFIPNFNSSRVKKKQQRMIKLVNKQIHKLISDRGLS